MSMVIGLDLKATQIIFEELGGCWLPEDTTAFVRFAEIQEGRGIWIYHVVLGLCRTIAESREHRLTGFAAAVPAIIHYASVTCEYPADVIGVIACDAKLKTLDRIKSGRWE